MFRRLKSNRLQMLLTVFCLSIACTPADKHRPKDGQKAQVDASYVGKIRAVRSPVWLAGSLYTESDSGKKRNLAPGDKVFLGETLHTRKSLRTEVELADESTLDIQENTSLSFEKLGKKPVMVFLRGETLVSKPLGHEEPLQLRAENTTVRLDRGRLFLSNKDGEKGKTVLRVDAGEVFLEDTGSRVRPGQTLILDNIEKPTPQNPVSVTKGIPLPPIPSPLTSLTPESIKIPVSSKLQRGIGTLTARAPRSGRTSENALDLVKHLVKVTIRDGVALTQVEESFTNHSPRTVEGTYRFMLPGDASITRLALDVGGRIEEGEVLEKKRARRIFKKIVDDSVRPRDPALLEWERGSSFSMKIFPIKGKETRTVYLSYMQPLVQRDGVYQYIYPLGGPAGVPEVGQFDIQAEVNMQLGVDRLWTPQYDSAIQVGDNRVTTHFHAEKYTPALDYILQFTPQKKPPELRVASQTEKDGVTYAMALINPKLPTQELTSSTQTLMILDTSYGIDEHILAMTRATVMELLANASSQDTFALLACDSDCRALSTDFLHVDGKTLKQAESFLANLSPGGASNISGALATAFSFFEQGVLSKQGVPGTVLYFGDGVPTAGELDLGGLRNTLVELRPRGVSLHTIGIGPNMDTLALQSLASHLGGTSYLLSASETPIAAAARINRLLHSQVFTDVTIQWPQGVESAYPNLLGAYPSGRELLVTAKLLRDSVEGNLIFRGRTATGQTVERSYPLQVSASAPAPGFISRLFAKAHLDHLTLEEGNDKEIVQLSTKARIASRLTSWIVLENQRMYNEFNVKRTDSEMWKGEGAEFQTIEDVDDDGLEDLQETESAPSEIAGTGSSLRGQASGGAAGGPASDTRAKRKKAGRTRASAPAAKMTPSSKSAESMPPIRHDHRIVADDFIGTPPPPIPRRPAYTITIKRPGKPSTAALRRLKKLQEEVEKYPQRRSSHRRLLQILARLGRTNEAQTAAEKWRDIDPLSTSALRTLADTIARTGDRNQALRLYASLAELNPASGKIHLRLAQAYQDLGRFDAAAGHYRAAASAKRGQQEAWIEYLSCLIGAKQMALYRLESNRIKNDNRLRKLHQQVDNLTATEEAGGISSPTTTGPGSSPLSRRETRGDLQIRLELQGTQADLDISVIDPTGRRISGIWRRDAAANFLMHPSQEQLFIRSMKVGSYQVLISRVEGNQTATISGKLHIKAKNKRRTVPFTLSEQEISVATVRYQRHASPYVHYR